MTGINHKTRRTKLCPYCGTIQRIGQKCSICGAPVTDPEVKVLEACPECGKQRPVGARCVWCGNAPAT